MPKRHEGPSRNKSTGFYYFDHFVGFGKDRRRIRYSLKTKDPEKARWLWEKEYRKRWSEYYGIQSPMKHSEISFQDMAEEFIDYEKNIKRIREWSTARDRLRIVSEVWGNISISNISKEHLIRLDEYLRAHDRSKATVNHYFGLLKTFFNFAIRKKYILENPIREVRPYTVDEKRREYSPEELEQILDAAERVERECRSIANFQKYVGRIILLLLYTGMRMGEVLNLKWENIGEDRIVLRRTETKQKKEKMIPLTSGVREILKDLKEKRRMDGYVVPLKRKGKEIYTTEAIKKIREYSGVQDFIFHNLRHTASTIMISEALGKGVGLADVMKILGHSRVETTMRYLHADFGRMKTAMEALERKIKRKND